MLSNSNPKMSQNPALRLAIYGLLTAMVFVFTYFIKIPTVNGYIHLGDAIILLSGAVIGPYAAICAGLGSALSDLLGGYAIYILPTLIIKAAMGLVAGLFLPNASVTKRILTLIFAEIIMVFGYALAETFMFGFASALSTIPMNLIQGGAGVVLGMPLCMLGDRLRHVVSIT